jgi:putative redox protein
MSEVEIWYEGDLSTRAVDLATKSEITTDAPKDNRGLGRTFSPTDLVGVALGSCSLTLMGITANRLKVDIGRTRAVVTKTMSATPPRRIAILHVEIHCPNTFSEDVQKALIDAVEACPVHQSLHPEVKQEFQFHWGSN